MVNGAAPPTDLALLTTGGECRSRSTGWSFMATFDDEFASRLQTDTGTARVKYSW